MASYTFIAELVGEAPIALSSEHLKWDFFDEKDMQLFGPYKGGGEPKMSI
jgi:hypothetical protein